ncbi:nucleotidyltransferase family protein [Hymenobacter lapidiphilus]|uniref:Nucleotidyltransferase domain-containing protein n=1 Tax=Hymenobacter lapidiphilus TaxID=2608003 RepID=A0A7Y7PL49_9BACT|nr:nucleotidyltransferase domain-containing protein [Hymenobacter lapidiphilus]NVO29762.1 nucleotidyltransferase domain-containing protein [Hymenobacter lapidiphilus]
MQVFNLNLNAIEELCQQHRVRQLFGFGSALTPAFGPDSDVDLVAEFEPMPLEQYADNYFRFKFALEELFGRPVDLLEAQAVRNPYFRQQLEATRQLLYAA